MNMQSAPNIEEIRRQVLATIHAHWKLFLIQGVAMIVLGMLAVALPNISTLEIELLVGWLFIVGGFLRVVTIYRKRHMPGFWWSLLSGILAMIFGMILIARPLQGIVTLTVVLTAFFIIEGVAAIFIALDFRRHLRHWGWTLLSGIVSLGLAYLIVKGWPSTAAWVIGLYVGVNMIFFGMSLIMTSIAARRISGA
jgi:uncharacterized membrane protein HdeD (DUF308 family)